MAHKLALLLEETPDDFDSLFLKVILQTLLELSGAIALMTYDGFMLECIAMAYVGLDGVGGNPH